MESIATRQISIFLLKKSSPPQQFVVSKHLHSFAVTTFLSMEFGWHSLTSLMCCGQRRFPSAVCQAALIHHSRFKELNHLHLVRRLLEAFSARSTRDSFRSSQVHLDPPTR